MSDNEPKSGISEQIWEPHEILSSLAMLGHASVWQSVNGDAVNDALSLFVFGGDVL